MVSVCRCLFCMAAVPCAGQTEHRERGGCWFLCALSRWPCLYLSSQLWSSINRVSTGVIYTQVTHTKTQNLQPLVSFLCACFQTVKPKRSTWGLYYFITSFITCILKSNILKYFVLFHFRGKRVGKCFCRKTDKLTEQNDDVILCLSIDY